MTRPHRVRLQFWHKLLIAFGCGTVVLAVGLTLTAFTSIRVAATEAGVRGKEILAEQTEQFLTSIVRGQSDVLDLQLHQGRIAALHGAAFVESLIGSGATPDPALLGRVLRNAGAHSVAIYYAAADGTVVRYPSVEHPYSPTLSTLPDSAWELPGTTAASTVTLWSNVHPDPSAGHHDRVVNAVAPVFHEGRLVGHVGVSISVIALVSQFNDRQGIRGSYTLLVSNQRELIWAQPHAVLDFAPAELQRSPGVIDSSRSENEEVDATIEDMALRNTAVRRVEIRGQSKYVAYRPLAQIDWSLGVVVPEALATVATQDLVRLIDDKKRQALTLMVSATLIYLVIVLVVGAVIVRRMTRPLVEMAMVARNGARGQLERRIEPAGFDEIGELARAFNAMTSQLREDINSIQQQRQELHESEARYRALFENSPISLWVGDLLRAKVYLTELFDAGISDLGRHFADNPSDVKELATLIRIVDINEATLQLFGGTSKPDLNATLPRLVTETSPEVLQQGLVALAATNAFETECRSGTLDGRTITIGMHWVVPPEYEDSWRRVLVAIIDVTARSEAEEERRRLEEQLRHAHKMEAMGTLAGGIAHDFNNILSAITGYTELLDSQPDLKQESREFNRRVLTASRRAKDLVQQILAFSRRAEQTAEPVQVKELVTETLDLLRASLPSTIEIHHELHGDSQVMANGTQLHQVLMALCTNAAHAMRERGGVLTVRVDDVVLRKPHPGGSIEIPAGDWVRLQVEDTGHGMTQEIIGRIFDPFFTIKGRVKGTGMGLSVAHGIVAGFGGLIAVRSQPGRGSTFDVYLPRTEPEVKEKPAERPAALPGGNESILFVDDEEALAELANAMLGRLGYRVSSYTNSLSALEAVREEPGAFDLVISDMTMPHLTGDKLVAAIHDINPGLPIILCSGFNERLEEVQRTLPISGFLMKPVELRDLSLLVRRVLDAGASDPQSQVDG